MEDKELKALVSLLDDEDAQIVSHVEEKILSIGVSIIPLLESEWENCFNPKAQERIEELIHTLQYELVKKRLKEWFEGPDHDLLTGMWIVSTYQYPDTDLTQLRQELEQIYYETWLEFRNDLYPFDQVKVINSVLFGKLKFGPNSKNFHSPGNSLINVVLETHKGNPITLSVIYMLVAQTLKLPVYGVNLPNLFILTYKDEKQTAEIIEIYSLTLFFGSADLRLSGQGPFFREQWPVRPWSSAVLH